LWNRFPIILKYQNSLANLFDTRGILMIQVVQLGQRRLCLTIGDTTLHSTAKGERRIQFDLGEGSTITEFHRRELMDFVEPFYPERASLIGQLILKLLDAQTRVGRIEFDLFDSSYEVLQLDGATDIAVEFSRRTVKGARREEDISLCFTKCGLD
jgi:hypothetical protein